MDPLGLSLQPLNQGIQTRLDERMCQSAGPALILDQELVRGNLSKSLRRFRSDQDEIWQECSLSKCALTEEVRFLI